MPFPPNRRELKFEGYDYHGQKTCPCGERIELWHTPRDQTLPMNPMPDDDSPAVSHWATCSKAQQFRRQSAAKMPAKVSVDHSQKQGSSQSEAQSPGHLF